MERFKDKLRLDNIVTAICIFFLALFAILAAAAEAGAISFLIAGDSHWQSAWPGFISGAAFGIMGVMVAFLIRNILALRDEKKLKKLYIQETDERTIAIWSNARVAAYRTFLVVALVAGVIAGYFSITVSITIIACAFFASIIGLIYVIYYSRKL